MDEKKERVLIVCLHYNQRNKNTLQSAETEMEELIQLVEACDLDPVARVEQNLDAPTQALYIGTGKVQEVREVIAKEDIDVVVFDHALSPVQLRNLQRELDIPILDRTALILEIFAKRAKSREARMQVEVARLQYSMPRLVGLHAALGRQGGGSGLSNKGSGEKKIELDRRRILGRIHELERELKQIEKDRETQRKQRVQSGMPRIALVGYTNAGKSTLMNAMLSYCGQEGDKQVFVQDMLFATLDTTVRKITTDQNKSFLLSDTVGFVSDLPHELVKAFRSTLEEVREADILLHVIDFSDPFYKEQQQITKETLREIEAEGIPTITIYNKADLKVDILPLVKEDSIYMSAKTEVGLSELFTMIEERAFSGYELCQFKFPYDKGSIVSYLNEQATVKETEYLEDGILVTVHCKQEDSNRYQEYKIS